MLVANGRPSMRIHPVVEVPMWVDALMVVVAIHAFQTVPPRKAAWADAAQNASAFVRLEPTDPATRPPEVTNTMFMLGRKWAAAVRLDDMVSVQAAPCPVQSALQAVNVAVPVGDAVDLHAGSLVIGEAAAAAAVSHRADHHRPRRPAGTGRRDVQVEGRNVDAAGGAVTSRAADRRHRARGARATAGLHAVVGDAHAAAIVEPTGASNAAAGSVARRDAVGGHGAGRAGRGATAGHARVGHACTAAQVISDGAIEPALRTVAGRDGVGWR